MAKKNRIIAILLAITIFFVVLCSALFVTLGADHDCIGEKCAICNSVYLFEELQKILTFASGILEFSHLFLLLLLFCVAFGQATKIGATPITLKVKLLN